MTAHIVTWFHTDDAEQGSYAQVSGDSRTEQFRDVYRRCIATFFASARRTNPDARLELVVNAPWDASASTIANEVQALLTRLHVTISIVPYVSEPPQTFTAKWRNQFYVLDVLDHLREGPKDDLCLVLDSDIVWAGQQSVDTLWSTLARAEITTMPIGYPRTKVVNGASCEQISALTSTPHVYYCGGEFVSVRRGSIGRLLGAARSARDQLNSHHHDNPNFAFEEAHVLSVAYAKLGAAPLPHPAPIRRMWTQPLKPHNTVPEDLERALWHVPAEKKYGLRRMYRDLSKRGVDWDGMADTQWSKYLSRRLGVPTNTTMKWISDVTTALYARLRRR
ncbi:hypothetical protein [Demequina sediminicola]|uniref:hypothetical protein n=1 Tax=Demequina sediminicola TaxID=1095026 RepID=UPI0007829D67|nr:hypothetical protein [Demequina sediminicola]